ncbi:MAG: hypothetical protein A2Y74_07105 [Actinobacteria bacterium RBG_13_63_9]|nr:MAG: hypothetical protein A2Y74_07105 [Actinobacteria bacterium RBG_13_63_9]
MACTEADSLMLTLRAAASSRMGGYARAGSPGGPRLHMIAPRPRGDTLSTRTRASPEMEEFQSWDYGRLGGGKYRGCPGRLARQSGWETERPSEPQIYGLRSPGELMEDRQ